MDILIRDATIVTQDKARRIIKGDIFVSEGNIAKIGKGLGEKAEETIDGSGKLVFPGLNNTHTHVAMALFRGYGEGMRLQDWLTKRIWPAEAKLAPDDVYWGSMLGMAEMIRSGTTAFNEMYVAGLEKIAKAAEKSGIRATVALGMFDRVPGHEPEKELEKAEKLLGKVAGMRKERINAAVSCHAPYTCSGELIRKGKELAKERKLQFHIHAAETRKEVFDILKEEKKRPIEYLDSLGVLDSRTVLAHSVYVTKREIGLVGKAKACVSHNPVSNMKLAGGGVCPISEFAAAGACATLGTDGAASNNSLNMIETMKMAALLQKNHYWDPLAAGAQDVLDYATLNGARALGINAGSIEEGKLADLVLADLKAPNMAPHHDHVANIVYSMNPANITDVMINGEFVLREKRIVKFDEEEAVEKASAAAAGLAAR